MIFSPVFYLALVFRLALLRLLDRCLWRSRGGEVGESRRQLGLQLQVPGLQMCPPSTRKMGPRLLLHCEGESARGPRRKARGARLERLGTVTQAVRPVLSLLDRYSHDVVIRGLHFWMGSPLQVCTRVGKTDQRARTKNIGHRFARVC